MSSSYSSKNGIIEVVEGLGSSENWISLDVLCACEEKVGKNYINFLSLSLRVFNEAVNSFGGVYMCHRVLQNRVTWS